jgi:hypothetical protein
MRPAPHDRPLRSVIIAGIIMRSTVIVFALALGAWLVSEQTFAASRFGSFSLAPGESKTIFVDPPYGYIRLCNDAGSAGTLEAVIDGHEPVALAPGICYDRDNGDRIALHNPSSSTVTGIYRAQKSRALGGR